jgi:hypothetical protein
VNLVNLIDSMWNPPKFHQQVQNIFQLSTLVRPLADVLFGRKSNGNSTNYTHYANANRAANTFVDPAILADPAVYRDDEVKKRLWTQKSVSEEVERARMKAWLSIKTGSSF